MTRELDLPVLPVQPLFDGPLDIVGDVHGEWLALRSLLAHLGYDAHGEHRLGRRLVFVGDLCDRGPDSPAVMEFVQRLVERGVAQCVLGNHELNLVRQERKPGNGWFFDEHRDHARPEYRHARRATARDRDAIRHFAASLPLALQRADLRVTHAAWHEDSVRAVSQHGAVSHLDRYRHYETQVDAAVGEALAAQARAERREFGAALYDRQNPVPLLGAIAITDELYQMRNPLRVLTSGLERRAARSFFASGKWRMVERVAWWQEYAEPIPVVMGHYWRWIDSGGRAHYSHGELDLFRDVQPFDWLGPRANVYCIDYSVGARFREIHDGHAPGTFTRLAALRWPERDVVTENGERIPT